MYRPFVITALIGLGLIVSDRFGLTNSIVTGFSYLTSPVLAAESQALRQSVNYLEVIRSIHDLAKENMKLRERNTELEGKLSDLKEVINENVILRSELNFAKDTEDSYLPTQLIGRTPTGITKDLIVDRGQRDGLTHGQAVIAQGHLIGVVSSVSINQSTVMLLSNPRAMTPIITQESRSTGILRGGFGGLTVNDLLADAEVKNGESIVTSGLGGLLPSGIPIGKIIQTVSRPGDITKKAIVHSPVDVTKLEMVFIRKVN